MEQQCGSRKRQLAASADRRWVRFQVNNWEPDRLAEMVVDDCVKVHVF